VPPAVFVAKVAGVGASLVQSFATPAARKVGDTYLAIIVTQAESGLDPDLSPEWEEMAVLTPSGTETIVVARRIAAEDDPGTLTITLTAAGTFIVSALVVYRDLNTTPAIVAPDASATRITASTNFVCPSRTLTRYSDLYLGIVAVTSAAVAVTPPAGTTERHDASDGAGHELEVFDLLAETVGATGTKIATTAGAQSGIAASLALASLPVQGLGKSFAIAPVGSIGLPTVGV
jgi:hypothetical protein